MPVIVFRRRSKVSGRSCFERQQRHPPEIARRSDGRGNRRQVTCSYAPPSILGGLTAVNPFPPSKRIDPPSPPAADDACPKRSISMNDNPFTFDMFGSAALSTGIGIGDTAFGDFSPVAANDDDPDPNPSSPAPRCRLQPRHRRVAQHGLRTSILMAIAAWPHPGRIARVPMSRPSWSRTAS